MGAQKWLKCFSNNLEAKVRVSFTALFGKLECFRLEMPTEGSVPACCSKLNQIYAQYIGTIMIVCDKMETTEGLQNVRCP